MTKLYLDTEYNGFGGKLISMALVGHKDHWYQARMIRGALDPWVKEYVMPVLDTKPVSHDYFKAEFRAWVTRFNNPEIICDWHADAEHFCHMLRGSDHESSLDYPCSITILKTPPGQPVSAKPHNALADAVALRDWHAMIQG